MNRNIKLLSKIDNGGFGEIYLIEYNSKNCILKKETNDYKTIKNEINIYLKLIGVKNIAKILDYFTLENNNCIIIEYYDFTLDKMKFKFFNCNNYNNYINSIIRIIINTIKEIHNLSILHRDIKPTNICLNKNFSPVLIDFGLSKIYIINDKHIDNIKINNIIGSNNFVSNNIINLCQPSRRDDLISCFYVYIYLFLDFQKDKNFNGSKINNEYIKKNNNINNKDNIIKLNNYLNNLSYYQTPNYSMIVELF